MSAIGGKEEGRVGVDEFGGSVWLMIVKDVQLFIIVQTLSPFASHLHIDFLTILFADMLELGVFLLPLRTTGLAGQQRHQAHPSPTM